MQTLSLSEIGWNKHFEEQAKGYETMGLALGRISAEHKERYAVVNEKGSFSAEISGKLLFEAAAEKDFPKIGDWVLLNLFEEDNFAVIEKRLERMNVLARKAAGKKTEKQILAANVDTIFIVTGLDGNFNPRRIERYLVNFAHTGIRQVVLLSKTDICPDTDDKVKLLRQSIKENIILPYSAVNGEGIKDIEELLEPGNTAVFLGSSGSGKSTLINKLYGKDLLITAETRSDSRGRHTTVTRELFISGKNGILIDTPGMRELQLAGNEEGLHSVFSDIADLAAQCKFLDCTHTIEPDCAVLKALENEEITQQRYAHYLKMKKEIAHFETTAEIGNKLAEKKKWKAIHKEIKRMKKKRE